MWLKQWDSCVFGSEIKSTTDDVLSSLKRHTSVAQHQKVSNRGYFGKNRESRFSEENFKVHNNLDQGNHDSKNIQELWNKKHKVSGPPEQKVSCSICLKQHTFGLEIIIYYGFLSLELHLNFVELYWYFSHYTYIFLLKVVSTATSLSL